MRLYVGEGETVEDLRAGRSIQRVVDYHAIGTAATRAINSNRARQIGADVSATKVVRSGANSIIDSCNHPRRCAVDLNGIGALVGREREGADAGIGDGVLKRAG